MTAPRRTARFLRTTLAAGAATGLVLLSGCSSSSDDSDSGGSGGDSSAARDVAGDVPQAEPGLAEDAGGGSAETVADTANPGVEAQQVISTGNVQLRSDDVGQSMFDIRKIVDLHQGTVSEDNTETDEDGGALRSRMVLRIPTANFDEAMTELEKVATLVSSQRESADVTTEVLDIGVRVEAQQRSIDRIQVLFDNATSIKDVVSIESELSRRQADLASLQAQQRYLADQTSMSTITLAVERTAEHAEAKPKDDDDTGFMAGLAGGWHALRSFLVGASTVAGALLPWLVLAALLAIPGWPLARRLRRRQATPA